MVSVLVNGTQARATSHMGQVLYNYDFRNRTTDLADQYRNGQPGAGRPRTTSR